MTNDQINAANLLENTLDLIRQVLLKHETAVLTEFRRIIEAKNHGLKLIYTERDALKQVNMACGLLREAEIHITALATGFNPPSLVRPLGVVRQELSSFLSSNMPKETP